MKWAWLLPVLVAACGDDLPDIQTLIIGRGIYGQVTRVNEAFDVRTTIVVGATMALQRDGAVIFKTPTDSIGFYQVATLDGVFDLCWEEGARFCESEIAVEGIVRVDFAKSTKGYSATRR